eukprot:PhM_4_TR1031/c0_g1_i1/m.19236
MTYDLVDIVEKAQDRLDEAARHAAFNKAQCKRLAQRVGVITKSLRYLKQVPRHQLLVAMQSFEELVGMYHVSRTPTGAGASTSALFIKERFTNSACFGHAFDVLNVVWQLQSTTGWAAQDSADVIKDAADGVLVLAHHLDDGPGGLSILLKEAFASHDAASLPGYLVELYKRQGANIWDLDMLTEGPGEVHVGSPVVEEATTTTTTAVNDDATEFTFPSSTSASSVATRCPSLTHSLQCGGDDVLCLDFLVTDAVSADDSAVSEIVLEHFFPDAQNRQRWVHPNVLPVRSVAQARQVQGVLTPCCCLVMDRPAGSSLSSVLFSDGREVGLRQALLWAQQLADGMVYTMLATRFLAPEIMRQYATLVPTNIFLSSNGASLSIVPPMDYGCGTHCWSVPSTALCPPAYSLALILTAMLTNKRPPPASVSNLSPSYHRILWLRSLMATSTMPKELSGLLERCLECCGDRQSASSASDDDGRLQTVVCMDEFVATIRRLLLLNDQN